MPDEIGGFETRGLTWQQRAERCTAEAAVFDPDDLDRSRWLALLCDVSLERALRRIGGHAVVLDFGCGIGRQSNLFARRAGTVVALDITQGMLERARHAGVERNVILARIDGVRLPLGRGSVDLAWAAGVLRYSLAGPRPRYREIADELRRVLRPDGALFQLEMYVDQPAEHYTRDIVEAGFELCSSRVVHWHHSGFDRLALGRLKPLFLRRWWARLTWRLAASPRYAERRGLRDYLLVYRRRPEV